MSSPFWNYRDDFTKVAPGELIGQFWEDDDLNRTRSLVTFSAEIGLVDSGLEIYVEPIQRAFSEKDQWKDNLSRRAGIAMLIHAFNSFLARRHLLINGYLAESRLFSRNSYESLCQALAFAQDETLAKKFYEARDTKPKAIHKALSKIFARTAIDRKDVLKSFADRYKRLAAGAHPTLESFSLRTGARSVGTAGLRQAVPEDVVIGGLLADELGKIAWLTFARGIADATVSEKIVFGEISKDWDLKAIAFGDSVEKLISENEHDFDGSNAE